MEVVDSHRKFLTPRRYDNQAGRFDSNKDIRKHTTFSLVTKRVGQRDAHTGPWPVSQGLTQQLSIRHCQLVQCHELLEMRRAIVGMKNDPRKPLIFRPLFPGEYTKHGDGFLDAAWNKTSIHYSSWRRRMGPFTSRAWQSRNYSRQD